MFLQRENRHHCHHKISHQPNRDWNQTQAGDQIACGGFDTGPLGFPAHKAPFNDNPNVDGICASPCHNTPDAKVRGSTFGDNNDFADVITDLQNIGATRCGTAPLIRTSDDDEARITYLEPNDLSTRYISINYVTKVCEAEQGTPCPPT